MGIDSKSDTVLQENCGAIGPFEVSIIRSHERATKAFTLEANGKIKKEGEPPLSRGQAFRGQLRDGEHLADTLEKTKTNEVYVPRQMQKPGDGHLLTTRAKLDANPSCITRTKDQFLYNAGQPAAMVLDIDYASWPDHIKAKVTTAGGIFAVLTLLVPELAGAELVWRHSVSSGIRCKRTGERTGIRGLHFWIFVKDGGDARRFSVVLFNRLLLAGYGFIFPGTDGKAHLRTLVDKAASGDGSRLVYEAHAELLNPALEHEAGVRRPRVRKGHVLDTTCLADLTGEEADELLAIENALRGTVKLSPGTGGVRSSRAADQGLTAKGRAIVRLRGDCIIHLDTGKKVRASDIFLAPAAYHRATCADPDEPAYGGGRNKAVIYSDNPRAIRIESEAHGGISYRITLTAADVLRIIERQNHEA
ncbi:hypothetical protein [Bauldia litoralis]|uniref:Uncharacterized protein n=1 Tax=Bauldia litoralis TaxID=665467 RepID=A0A1G6A5M6_9HYPH|nr:hypothetical protein [Bauldia litoralis]SDB03727.1 hypothetical protein SAMN02982931_00203 [Bauldia litoralis]